MQRKFILTLGLLLAALCIEAPLLAGTEPSTAQGWFSDRPLQNQQGEPLQFYSDVLKDQVVLINFMFTHCETACPMSTQRLAQVQQPAESGSPAS